MEVLIKRFRTEFWQKKYDDMEGTWLELVEAGAGFEQMMELVLLVERQVPRGTMATMLSLLADSARDAGRFGDELDVLRRQATLTPEDAALGRTVAACIQRIYSGVPELEQLLHKSGLGYGQSLKDALPRLEHYLALLPGVRVYDADRGPGRVTKLDLLLDRVAVDFDMGAQLTFDVAAAQRVLRVAAPDGYYASLAKKRAALTKIAEDEPGRVVSMFLRDVGKPMSVKEIQDGMSQLVPGSAWDGFWGRARRYVAADPPKKGTRVHVDFDPDEVTGKAIPAVVGAYSNLATFAERKHFVEGVVDARPDDWADVCAALFLVGKDGRARAVIEKLLAEKDPARWSALLDTALTGYRQNPEAFLWLVENFERLHAANAKAILIRLLDLLESALHKPHWIKLRNAATDSDYHLARLAVEKMDEPEATRFVGTVQRIKMFDGYLGEELVQLAVARFPSLDQTHADSVIYTTSRGMEKAKAELRQMAEIEVPKVADEIARARAHGDLSENYEYKAAKEKQGRLMMKLKRQREEVARARVILPPDVDVTEVSVGCKVRLEGKAGNVLEYAILGPWDADHERGVISYLSPFAQVMMGKKPGDSVEMDGQPYRIAVIESGLPD
jgi:transcription elongation GreA/GreB family factor/transcription elongation factor GreA-like protein